jgi:peptide-methionine (S)-S-oxide reductase
MTPTNWKASFAMLSLAIAVGATNMNEAQADKPGQGEKLETATLGNGCFWCTEAVFAELKGVKSAVSGYSGGFVENPSYQQVCTGRTGHAEVLQVTFDPEVISFAKLLEVFFATHDPTTLNAQGPDRGPQYRSAIFYHSDEQKREAEEIITRLDDDGVYDSPIVTEVTEFKKFYPAEDYHQEYFANNPRDRYCRNMIPPKLGKLKKSFADILKEKGESRIDEVIEAEN